MKKLAVLLLIALTVVACSKEEAKITPVTPTSNPTPTTSTTLQNLQGLWYNNMWSLDAGTLPGGGLSTLGIIELDVNCKVDFTMNNPIVQPSYTIYDMYGMFGNACNYPTSSTYYYNPSNNTIIGSFIVEYCTSDTLTLSTSTLNATYFHHRIPFTTTNANTIEWELELTSPYAVNNDLEIVTLHNGSFTPVNTVPITTTQQIYSGTDVVSLNPASPTFNISINRVGATIANPPNVVQFDAKLMINGQVISESTGNSLCVGAPCTGNDFFSGAVGPIVRVSWNK